MHFRSVRLQPPASLVSCGFKVIMAVTPLIHASLRLNALLVPQKPMFQRTMEVLVLHQDRESQCTWHRTSRQSRLLQFSTVLLRSCRKRVLTILAFDVSAMLSSSATVVEDFVSSNSRSRDQVPTRQFLDSPRGHSSS